jgi:hypothetical protein
VIVGAAVCPGAPFLVPGLAPALAESVRDLVDSCAEAIATLVDVDRIVLLTSGPRALDRSRSFPLTTVLHPPGATVTSGILTNSRLPGNFRCSLAGTPGTGRHTGEAPGVGVVVGAALAVSAGISAATTAIELVAGPSGSGSWTDPSSPAGRVLAGIEAPGERVGLLVVGEGSASRGAESSGDGCPGAKRFDDSLVSALRTGDPAMLGVVVDVEPEEAARLVFTSRSSFGALAAITSAAPPTRSELLYAGAPLGVGYVVARWSWG